MNRSQPNRTQPNRSSSRSPGRGQASSSRRDRSSSLDADGRSTAVPEAASTHDIKLRIIGGRLGGRVIRYHGRSFTRPMKDPVRENLFNLIGPSIAGCRAIDLFAGTGALAFESISRGASSADVVERDAAASKWIRDAADTLDVADRCRVLTGDAFAMADSVLRLETLTTLPDPNPFDQAVNDDDSETVADDDDWEFAASTPWLLFLCPPYALWNERLDDLQTIINRFVTRSPPTSRVVIETDGDFDWNRLAIWKSAAESLAKIKKPRPKNAKVKTDDWVRRQYGRVVIGIYTPPMKCGLVL